MFFIICKNQKQSYKSKLLLQNKKTFFTNVLPNIESNLFEYKSVCLDNIVLHSYLCWFQTLYLFFFPMTEIEQHLGHYPVKIE